MNTKHINQIRTATVAAVVAFVACAGTTTPAFAAHTHGDDDRGTGTSSISPYAEPIAALGGMTLAIYIQRHHAGRTHTVV
jgi:hypothetical protein